MWRGFFVVVIWSYRINSPNYFSFITRSLLYRILTPKIVMTSILLSKYCISRLRPLQEKKTEWQFEISWGKKPVVSNCFVKIQKIYASFFIGVKEKTSRVGQCSAFVKKRMRKMFFQCLVLLFCTVLVHIVILMTACQLLSIWGKKDKSKLFLQ